jgi:ribosome-binding protein aMBF1 (putative translation factor)
MDKTKFLYLQTVRKEAGLSQAELARRIGKDQRTISGLECLRIKGPVEVWEKLEAVLGVDHRVLRRIEANRGERLTTLGVGRRDGP